ncbi:hypothetical protein MRX96_047328 [Rhipicephalus microplus]
MAARDVTNVPSPPRHLSEEAAAERAPARGAAVNQAARGVNSFGFRRRLRGAMAAVAMPPPLLQTFITTGGREKQFPALPLGQVHSSAQLLTKINAVRSRRRGPTTPGPFRRRPCKHCGDDDDLVGHPQAPTLARRHESRRRRNANDSPPLARGAIALDSAPHGSHLQSRPAHSWKKGSPLPARSLHLRLTACPDSQSKTLIIRSGASPARR